MNFRAKAFCCLLAAFTTVVFLYSTAIGQSPGPRRIYFARGATTASVRGYLRGVGDEAFFVLRAKSGQHMRIEIKGRGPTRGVVFFPSGKQDGGPGGVVFDGDIDETGDYRIRVTESSMANAWRGSFTLEIEILTLGTAGNQPAGNGLAQYAGKYPSELFKGVPSLKTRLRKLLGVNYQSFFDRFQTEIPIERDGDTLVARGCMAHQCTIEEAILVINLADGKLHCAIKSDRYGGRFKTFSEDPAHIPAALDRAIAWKP